MIINFPNNRAYTGNRPYADLILKYGSASSSVYKCLVDTGADYLLLPDSLATSLGFGHLLTTIVSISTAGGGVPMYIVKSLNVEIEGYKVVVDVLFSSISSTPLLGRTALLAAVEAGFTASDWLWT